MRRFLLLVCFLFVSFFCIAQQNIPKKIIGEIPVWYSQKLYQIQVGAYKTARNADDAYYKLIVEDMDPVREQYRDLTRVMLKRIPANGMMHFLVKLKLAGFNEVIIREDTSPAFIVPGGTISEKWEIAAPDSAYTSFEFNRDRNYVVVERSDGKNTHFGEYVIPQKDMIVLDDLGIVSVTHNSERDVSFSFSPMDEAGKEMSYNAVKAEAMAESSELDLFCRTWKVVNCTEESNISRLLFISGAGTYFFTDPDGQSSSLSRWRWYDDRKEEFEYSHDNWEHYGRVRITGLAVNLLEMIDPGYFTAIPGYSSADLNDYWELVPANNRN